MINYEAVTPAPRWSAIALLPFGFGTGKADSRREFRRADADVTIVGAKRSTGLGSTSASCANVGPRPTDDKPFVHKVGCGYRRRSAACQATLSQIRVGTVRIAIPVNSQLKHLCGGRQDDARVLSRNVDHLRDTIRD